ncbi:probable ATP-dependent RNA helicase DDX52 [Octopus sinensis]|uniref:Probable ATP-dependent RNA helicase DDX52 n=1 Tax=Octopus sinensis TaxID=2607531 RepID=A0A6P7SI43_9MOLL|nr:probable ATP-dependent RNA helicase DDX52 [Octopus sinensis]
MDGHSLFRLLGVGAKFDLKRFKSDAQKLKLIKTDVKETKLETDSTLLEEASTTSTELSKKKRSRKVEELDEEDEGDIIFYKQKKVQKTEPDKENSVKKITKNKDSLETLIRKKNKIHVHGFDAPPPVTDFEQLKNFSIHPRLLENAKKVEYTKPTPIQMQAIPVMMRRREIMACAPTGSGKTAAFALPVLNYLKEPRNCGIRSVILAPTRELSNQIYQEMQRLSEGLGLRIYYIKKANLKKIGPKTFSKKDILVTTPQRLVFVLSQEPKILSLSSVEWLIIDESDKLFEDGKTGFRDQLGVIYKACDSPNIRRAMFSATFAHDVEQWCKKSLNDVIQVYIGGKNTATETVEQQLMFVGSESGKLFALRDIVQKGIEPPVLIFVQSQERATELFQELIYDGINVDVIHAGRSQAQRENVVSSFREGKIWVLICTELMGRGIDFKGVNLVVNYDFPTSAISYIHRIGRTGRAGRQGKAITFFVEDDVEYLRSIATVMHGAGCPVPEYMLKLKRPSKKDRRKMAQKNPKRKSISTSLRENKKKLKRNKNNSNLPNGISKTKLKASREFPGKKKRVSKEFPGKRKKVPKKSSNK